MPDNVFCKLLFRRRNYAKHRITRQEKRQPTALQVDATDLTYTPLAYRPTRMTAIRIGWPVTASGRTEAFTCDAAKPTSPQRLDPTLTRRSPKRRRHDSFPSEAAVRATGLPNGRTRATGRWYPPGEPRSETASLLSRRGSGLQCNDGHANKRDAGARDIPAGQCNAIDDAQP